MSKSHGWKNWQHPGFSQPDLELCYRETQPGRVQHSLSGGPPDSSPAGPPHYSGCVLPLLLLSSCQQLLLLLQTHHGNHEVGDKEEKEFGQYWRLVDLCQDGADDAWQGRPGYGLGVHFYFGITNPGTVGGAELIKRLKAAKLKLSSTLRRNDEDIIEEFRNGHRFGSFV